MLRILALLVAAACACVGCSKPSPNGTVTPFTDNLVVDRPFGNAQLLIWGCPRLTSVSSIKGYGLTVAIRRSASDDIWSITVGEAEFPIGVDYSHASAGELVLTFFTDDPRHLHGYGEVPLTMETLHLEPNWSISSRSKILLEKEPFDAARAEGLKQAAEEALAADDGGDNDEFVMNLQLLRNMAVDSPEGVQQP